MILMSLMFIYRREILICSGDSDSQNRFFFPARLWNIFEGLQCC